MDSVNVPGLADQQDFFAHHELRLQPPAGGTGTLDDWAIPDLRQRESADFMDALASLR